MAIDASRRVTAIMSSSICWTSPAFPEANPVRQIDSSTTIQDRTTGVSKTAGYDTFTSTESSVLPTQLENLQQWPNPFVIQPASANHPSSWIKLTSKVMEPCRN